MLHGALWNRTTAAVRHMPRHAANKTPARLQEHAGAHKRHHVKTMMSGTTYLVHTRISKKSRGFNMQLRPSACRQAYITRCKTKRSHAMATACGRSFLSAGASPPYFSMSSLAAYSQGIKHRRISGYIRKRCVVFSTCQGRYSA